MEKGLPPRTRTGNGSSPPCYAREWDNPLSAGELIDLFNALLMAERTGVRIANACLQAGGLDEQAERILRDQLATASRIEVRLRALPGIDESATHADAEAVNRTLALRDPQQRMGYLTHWHCRGAQRIKDALPHVADEEPAHILAAVYTLHLDRIAMLENACTR